MIFFCLTSKLWQNLWWHIVSRHSLILLDFVQGWDLNPWNVMLQCLMCWTQKRKYFFLTIYFLFLFIMYKLYWSLHQICVIDQKKILPPLIGIITHAQNSIWSHNYNQNWIHKLKFRILSFIDVMVKHDFYTFMSTLMDGRSFLFWEWWSSIHLCHDTAMFFMFFILIVCNPRFEAVCVSSYNLCQVFCNLLRLDSLGPMIELDLRQ